MMGRNALVMVSSSRERMGLAVVSIVAMVGETGPMPRRRRSCPPVDPGAFAGRSRHPIQQRTSASAGYPGR